MAEDARRMPSRQAEYENLILNRRVEASTPFLSALAWNACGGEPRDLTGLSVLGGLDLSESGDMTALVLAHVDPTDGVWHIKPLFWLPEERLAEKAGRDRAPYDLWRDRGFLETTPGPVISYEDVAERLKEVFEDHQVIKIAFDQWHFDTFRPWLIKAGFSEQTIKEKFVEFGQGYRSMSPALRDLERLILEKKLRHGSRPLLNWCASNATIVRSAVGDRKLDKRQATRRVDGLIALTMAVGVAPTAWAAKVDIARLSAELPAASEPASRQAGLGRQDGQDGGCGRSQLLCLGAC